MLILMFFLLITSSINFFAMDSAHQIISHKRKFNFFNLKKTIEKGNSPEAFFKSNLTITPDEKKIIISSKGILYQTDIRPAFNNQIIDILLKHPSTKLSTMVSIGQKEDKSFLIVSAGNYFNKDLNKWTSEIIIYNNKSYIIKQQNWPIQAIKTNEAGTLLAAANLSSILLFDLKKDSMDCSGFGVPSNGYHSYYTKNRIVDITLNPKNFLFAAAKNGHTQLMSTDNGLRYLNQNSWLDAIKKIEYPTNETIIYSTSKGKTKITDIYALLEPQDHPKPHCFSKSKTHNHISLNSGNNIAAAHWTNNENLSEKERSTIYIHRLNNDEHEILELRTSFEEKTYDFISNMGQLEEHNAHFLTVTFYNNTIIALTTNGDIIIWQLPPTKKLTEETIEKKETQYNEKEKETEFNKPQLIRKRSYSENIQKPESFKTSSPRKPSPRTSSFLKQLTPRHSPRHSPQPSHSSSPNLSPRKNKEDKK